jgi:hypothetical protein
MKLEEAIGGVSLGLVLLGWPIALGAWFGEQWCERGFMVYGTIGLWVVYTWVMQKTFQKEQRS